MDTSTSVKPFKTKTITCTINLPYPPPPPPLSPLHYMRGYMYMSV